jgi:hypothetical protein
MWSKKPMPVERLAAPVPSRFSATRIWVSLVPRGAGRLRDWLMRCRSRRQEQRWHV